MYLGDQYDDLPLRAHFQAAVRVETQVCGPVGASAVTGPRSEITWRFPYSERLR